MTTCMHAKAHEEFFFFYATCRSAISWEVPVLNQCTSDKKIGLLMSILHGCSAAVDSSSSSSLIPGGMCISVSGFCNRYICVQTCV